MWGRVRAICGIGLVLLIVVIVISPYVDLPLTTLRAWQMARLVVSVLAACWALAHEGSGRFVVPEAWHALTESTASRAGAGRDLLGASCVLLC